MTAIRRCLDVALATLVGSVLVLGLVAHLAPIADARLLSIRTGSMAPTLPVGALVLAVAADPAVLSVGDVVSVESTGGTLITHRIAEIVQQDDRRMFRLRGDANPSPDPVLVVQDQIAGRVEMTIPLLGYLLAMLAVPSGIAAVVGLVGMLLTASWMLDELHDAEADDIEGDGLAEPDLAMALRGLGHDIGPASG